MRRRVTSVSALLCTMTRLCGCRWPVVTYAFGGGSVRKQPCMFLRTVFVSPFRRVGLCRCPLLLVPETKVALTRTEGMLGVCSMMKPVCRILRPRMWLKCDRSPSMRPVIRLEVRSAVFRERLSSIVVSALLPFLSAMLLMRLDVPLWLVS